MVTLAVVNEQLKDAGCKIRMWGRAEVRELCNILLPGETITQAINGQYEAGFAMLVATDFRILLIDKKPKYLTLKDIRFDMITELDFSSRLMDSTIHIFTPNRELRFTGYNAPRMRNMFHQTQHKVMELRHHYLIQQFQQQQGAQNTPPGLMLAQQAAERYDAAIDVSPLPASTPNMRSQASSQTVHGMIDATEDHVKLAAAMGSAGLKSIVYKGRVIKDYMAVPFSQRWRKRPYGYSHPSASR